ncbi:glycosyltransferase [Vibrio sp. TBV020]|uniref:glycosyltransferase n=1 Tax=Vibrio sp. TBV020 TaxID=3137398 RepID=UPI0038CD2CBA
MRSLKFNATIIVAFYNNTTALSCIINALQAQSDNFEVIIADDGSAPNNVEKVQEIISNSSMEIRHIWQSDNGFRKNRVLNKAVKAARSDYIIFIDGDCIPQSHFVSDHLENRELGYILNGRRVDLAACFKEPLHVSPTPQNFYQDNFFKIVFKYLMGDGKNVEKGIRVTNKHLSQLLNRKTKGIVGCNFSLHKSDLVKVNGFDNRYNTPGVGEDSDIEYRLVANGMKVKNIFYKAPVLHPIHPELTRMNRAYEIFEKTKKDHQIVALDGYEQAHQQD